MDLDEEDGSLDESVEEEGSVPDSDSIQAAASDPDELEDDEWQIPGNESTMNSDDTMNESLQD